MKRTKLLQEPDNDNIDLRNIIIEDKKEEADNGNVGAPGRPNNYYFNGLKWTEAPHDVRALPELKCLWTTFSLLTTAY